MRIIGGRMRGTKLFTLDGVATRPTLDRVKESLFNILMFNIQDSVVLDLFAGSGSISIEFISRGAEKVYANDNSRDAVQIINKNIEKTKSKDKIVVLNNNYIDALEKVKNEKFDIIFLDPPYETDFAIDASKIIINNNLLSEDGTIIIETDREKEITNLIDNNLLKINDIRKYGRVSLIFLVRKG